ncbi:hypothetical protein [Pseudomonas sp.]|uniref:hypothetical protein n=1 Tax=Pseudomonas sp. TaxID=306 RepID=UPI003265591E
MPLLFSLTQCGLSDLKAGEVCQKQAEAVSEKPATSRLFNVCDLRAKPGTPQSPQKHSFDAHQQKLSAQKAHSSQRNLLQSGSHFLIR